MPSLTHDDVIAAMRTVQEPELGRDLISLDMVKDVAIDGSAVSLKIELTTPACPLKDEIERNTRPSRLIGATGIDITWGAMVRRVQPRQAEQLVPGSRTSSRSRRARAASARARSASTSPSRWPRPARRSASSTPTSPARISR